MMEVVWTITSLGSLLPCLGIDAHLAVDPSRDKTLTGVCLLDTTHLKVMVIEGVVRALRHVLPDVAWLSWQFGIAVDVELDVGVEGHRAVDVHLRRLAPHRLVELG